MDGTPYWVTAQLQKVGTNGLATAPQVFAGPLYETSGPWFGGAFNPNVVGQSQVGTATFSSTNAYSATLQYLVTGVNVTKTIQRQTLRYINYCHWLPTQQTIMNSVESSPGGRL